MSYAGERPIRVMVVGRFTSIHTRRFAEELQRQGVEVAAVWFGRSEEQPKVKCYHPDRTLRLLGLPRTATIASVLYFWRAISDFRPDIIHVQDDPQLVNWLRHIQPRWVRLAYTSWGHALPSLLADASFQRSLRKAVLITSDAPDVLGEIVPFAPRARREIIRFGADAELFSPGAPDPAVLAEYGLRVGECYLISPRSLRPNYNQITLIRALPAVAARFPDVKLILKHHHVQNYHDSADYERHIWAEAERLDVAKRIIRLNHLPYEDLCHLYRVSRAAVSIPLEDGFPATIFETMGAGCPLVVSRDESYQGVVEDGRNALTVPAEDVEAVAKALVRILGDETLAAGLRQAGLASVREKGDFQGEIARLLKVYREILHEGPK